MIVLLIFIVVKYLKLWVKSFLKKNICLVWISVILFLFSECGRDDCVSIFCV